MTSLLSPSVRADTPPPARTDRPLVALAALGGLVAALGPLLVCLGVGVTGWFVTDAGAHGTPRDGLRVGALGWLAAHGSGVRVGGVELSAVPLGLSLLCALVVLRLARRVGESTSGHGPDADRISDGERDWTVPAAALVMTLSYAAVVVAAHVLAATPGTAPSLTASLSWTLGLGLLVMLPALAVGSGRAAIWVAVLPLVLRESVDLARRILRAWLLASLVLVLGALLLDLSTAANVLAQLHTSLAEALLLGALCVLLLPQAVLFGGSYLLGPGFAVGAGTLVSPSVVVLGPVPMVPLLAALPDAGEVPGWTPWLVAVPALLAVVVAARAGLRRPAARWDHVAARGAGGGVLAGLVAAVLAALAGGAVGPGRMRQIGPDVLEVLLHAVTTFGVGGLVGAVLAALWVRRSREGSDSADGPDGVDGADASDGAEASDGAARPST